MAIGADYPSPVTVNGFSCRNCTEVDEAKKFIDPAHPKDGPFGIDAKDHKTGLAKAAPDSSRSPSVILSGQLASLASTASAGQSSGQPPTFSAATAPATRMDISV